MKRIALFLFWICLAFPAAAQTVTQPPNFRTQLQANQTYFIATTGSDTTGNGTSGSPWASIQHAVNYVQDNLDLNGFQVTISVATGTYTTNTTISGGWAGPGTILIQGNFSTPSNVIISTTSADCFTVNGTGNVTFKLTGFKLQTTTGGNGITVAYGATLTVLSSMEYGATAGDHIQTSGNIQLGSATISGGGTAHLHVPSLGHAVYGASSTETISTSITVSAYFIGVGLNGNLDLANVSYVNPGNVTGKPFLVHHNGTVERLCSGCALADIPGTTNYEASQGGVINTGQSTNTDSTHNIGNLASVLWHSAATGMSVTSTTATLATIKVPAGMMGTNGVIHYHEAWSVPNNANTKTLTTALGGTTFRSVAVTTVASVIIDGYIFNQAANNAQIGDGALGTTGPGTATGSAPTGAIDTTADQNFTIAATAASGDTITLTSGYVELVQ